MAVSNAAFRNLALGTGYVSEADVLAGLLGSGPKSLKALGRLKVLLRLYGGGGFKGKLVYAERPQQRGGLQAQSPGGKRVLE